MSMVVCKAKVLVGVAVWVASVAAVSLWPIQELESLVLFVVGPKGFERPRCNPKVSFCFP